MANESKTISGIGREEIEGVGTTMVLAVLIAQLNRRHPGLAQDMEKDLERMLPDCVRSLSQSDRGEILAVLQGAVNKLLTSALVDPHGTVAGKQNTVDPTA